jgi:hypothetical protein
MVYADFTWSDAARARYLASSHQFRLVSSDFHINFPAEDAPLHSFQIVSDGQYAAYAVPGRSHVILMTPEALYLVPVADYERIVGRWPASKAPPKSPDPHLRLNNVKALWQDPSRDVRCQALESFQISSLDVMHREILRSCTPSVPTVSQVRQTIPRPLQPEVGSPLGTPLAAVRPSRRGARKSKAGGSALTLDGPDDKR